MSLPRFSFDSYWHHDSGARSNDPAPNGRIQWPDGTGVRGERDDRFRIPLDNVFQHSLDPDNMLVQRLPPVTPPQLVVPRELVLDLAVGVVLIGSSCACVTFVGGEYAQCFSVIFS